MIRANKAIASIIYYEEVIGASILNVLSHLHRELDARVWATRYAPRLCSVVEPLTENLLEL